MIFRQLFDSDTWTYTYILADKATREAVIIDSVREQFDRDLTLIKEMGLKLLYSIDTHIHADHITASGQFRNATGCKTGFSVHEDIECADLSLTEGDKIRFGEHVLNVLETPGHTQGCISFYVEGMVFTGDALLIRGCGRTDFQGGSSSTLYHSVKEKLLSLPDATLVYPGHDYTGKLCSTVGEEKAFNPRLTLDEADFVTFMGNLNLDPPKRIQKAVPANKACGSD